MLEHLEHADHVELGTVVCGDRKRFDGARDVGELSGAAAERRVLGRMCACDFEYLGRGVDGGDGSGGWEARGGLGEDAATATNVEVAEFLGRGRRVGLTGVAGLKEVVAEGVHQVEDAGGSMGVPPGGSEGVEVGDFRGVDGGVGAGAGRRRALSAMKSPTCYLYRPGCGGCCSK